MDGPVGSVHGEPAVPGTQQTVGRRGGLPPRLRPHDDEASAGTHRSSTPLNIVLMTKIQDTIGIHTKAFLHYIVPHSL